VHVIELAIKLIESEVFVIEVRVEQFELTVALVNH